MTVCLPPGGDRESSTPGTEWQWNKILFIWGFISQPPPQADLGWVKIKLKNSCQSTM